MMAASRHPKKKPGFAKRLTGIIDERLARLWLPQRRYGAAPCMVIGHRGTDTLPENTLESLVTAVSEGADGVELDIIFSRDGVPVVCHHDDISEWVAPD